MPDAGPKEEEQELEEEPIGRVDDVQEALNGSQENDNEGKVQRQLPTAADQSCIRGYHSIKKAAVEKVAALGGHEVTVETRKNGSIKWNVISPHDPMDEDMLRELDLV
jgi:hypothetical protein